MEIIVSVKIPLIFQEKMSLQDYKSCDFFSCTCFGVQDMSPWLRILLRDVYVATLSFFGLDMNFHDFFNIY